MTESELHRLAADRIRESLDVAQGLLGEGVLESLVEAAELVVSRLREGGKLLAFGNGGSATEAQHLAAELIGRLRSDRPALPAVALVDGSAALTAIANDYGFDEVFARQVDGLGAPGDVALALSTSGASANAVSAVRAARERGLATIALTGPDDSPLGDAVDVCLRIPGADAARIQEGHLIAIHVMCEIVERELPDGTRRRA
jgi:phosphoheptose isomerase